MDFYQLKKIEKGVHNINEMLVSQFVFEGDDKYVVLDTGCDIGNYTKYLEKKLLKEDKEVMVVNSHFHPDHSNGNHRFKKVYIGEKDVPFSGGKSAYFNLVDTISGAAYKSHPIGTLPLRPIVNKLLRTKKGKTKYVPLHDGDKIDLGDRNLVVKDLPGHTQGSIVLLDKKRKTIYTGDAVNMSTWLWTNPDMKLSEYSDTLRAFYGDIKGKGYKRLRCSHVPFPNRPSFIKDYAKFIDSIKQGKETIKFNMPGMPSPLCIKVRPSLKHLMYCCFYFEDQIG